VDVVDVVAQEPLVNTAENNLGGTIGTKQLQELPVSGRDFTKMLVLVPGSAATLRVWQTHPVPWVCLVLTVIADVRTTILSMAQT